MGAAAIGFAFFIARRTARRWQQREAAARESDAANHFTTFRATLAARGVSERVTRVVYNYFATRLRVTGRRYPAEADDGLWEVHLITYPEELDEVLGGLLIQLGRHDAVPPPAKGVLGTVGDLAVWLEREAGNRARSA